MILWQYTLLHVLQVKEIRYPWNQNAANIYWQVLQLLYPAHWYHIFKRRHYGASAHRCRLFSNPHPVWRQQGRYRLYNEITDYGKLKKALAENESLKDQVALLTEENNRLQAEQFELNVFVSFIS